jgi:hypothetical protein
VKSVGIWSALAISYSNLPWPLARLVASGAFVLLSLGVLAAVRTLRLGRGRGAVGLSDRPRLVFPDPAVDRP